MRYVLQYRVRSFNGQNRVWSDWRDYGFSTQFDSEAKDALTRASLKLPEGYELRLHAEVG